MGKSLILQKAAHAAVLVAFFCVKTAARLLPLAAKTGAGVILMHMKGTPRTMQSLASYDDVVAEVKS